MSSSTNTSQNDSANTIITTIEKQLPTDISFNAERCISFDTSNQRIGINTINPTVELDISGGNANITQTLTTKQIVTSDISCQDGSMNITGNVFAEPPLSHIIKKNQYITKEYVHDFVRGIVYYENVKAIDICNVIPSYATNISENDFSFSPTIINNFTIDACSINVGDYILINYNNSAIINGVYLIDSSNSYSYSLTRRADLRANTDICGGIYVFVEDGDKYKDTGWALQMPYDNTGVTIGDVSLNFIKVITFPYKHLAHTTQPLYQTFYNNNTFSQETNFLEIDMYNSSITDCSEATLQSLSANNFYTINGNYINFNNTIFCMLGDISTDTLCINQIFKTSHTLSINNDISLGSHIITQSDSNNGNIFGATTIDSLIVNGDITQQPSGKITNIYGLTTVQDLSVNNNLEGKNGLFQPYTKKCNINSISCNTLNVKNHYSFGKGAYLIETSNNIYIADPEKSYNTINLGSIRLGKNPNNLQSMVPNQNTSLRFLNFAKTSDYTLHDYTSKSHSAAYSITYDHNFLAYNSKIEWTNSWPMHTFWTGHYILSSINTGTILAKWSPIMYHTSDGRLAYHYIESDKKLKTNIVPFRRKLDIVNKLNPVYFNWIKSGYPDYGFIAQEIEVLIPGIIRDHNDHDDQDASGEIIKIYNYEAPLHLIPVLTKAIQDIDADKKAENTELKEEISTLKNRSDILKEKNANLNSQITDIKDRINILRLLI